MSNLNVYLYELNQNIWQDLMSSCSVREKKNGANEGLLFFFAALSIVFATLN